jgi:seryl-tRNA synthetase
MEASITTYRTNINTETTKKQKNEEEESAITTKITQMDETVKKLEEETVKIEEEATKAETSITTSTTTKVTTEVIKRKKIMQEKKKTALKNKIKKLKEEEEKIQGKIETNTKEIIKHTKTMSETTNTMTKVTTIHSSGQKKQKYASCQRLIISSPEFFDVSSICSGSMTSSSSTSMTLKGASGGLAASSQTCQMCYAQNPSCSGSGSAGISVVSFSVDTQGEADDLVQ